LDTDKDCEAGAVASPPPPPPPQEARLIAAHAASTQRIAGLA
jgi:hypothetical protein